MKIDGNEFRVLEGEHVGLEKRPTSLKPLYKSPNSPNSRACSTPTTITLCC